MDTMSAAVPATLMNMWITLAKLVMSGKPEREARSILARYHFSQQNGMAADAAADKAREEAVMHSVVDLVDKILVAYQKYIADADYTATVPFQLNEDGSGWIMDPESKLVRANAELAGAYVTKTLWNDEWTSDEEVSAYVTSGIYYSLWDSGLRWAVPIVYAMRPGSQFKVAYGDVFNSSLSTYMKYPWFAGWHALTEWEQSLGSLGPFGEDSMLADDTPTTWLVNPPFDEHDLANAARIVVAALEAAPKRQLTVHFYGPQWLGAEYLSVLSDYTGQVQTRRVAESARAHNLKIFSPSSDKVTKVTSASLVLWHHILVSGVRV